MCLTTIPALSSLPGANHTIYLDFDGHTTEGTTWNSSYGVASIVSPPYDLDGDPQTFNATELQRIESAWKYVAEDFAPFEINVTTVDPGAEALRDSGAGDTQWGVRVVITSETWANCGCGGHAYVGSFDDSQDEPVFVYNKSLTGVVEASSHEVGHAMGLRHDGYSGGSYYSGHGSGATSWGPVMGASYNRCVTQWSQGDYATATNSEDDLAIITSSTNGFGYRADDHADSAGGATFLASTGGQIAASGVIETTGDVDVFSFITGAGQVSLAIDPVAVGANLDIKADLYDAAGSLVASSNPASQLNAAFSLSLPAGQYFLHVDGVGTGDPFAATPTGYTDYGSLGQYTVAGTIIEAGTLPTLSIDDVAVNEADGVATFTVTLSGTVEDPVSVDFATVDQTAVAGSDYVATGGTLDFGAAGTRTITVAIVEDGTSEALETFGISLAGATNALIVDGSGMGTITDNDVSLSITDVSNSEGNLAKGKKNSGSPQLKDFTFTVQLSAASGAAVTVDFATADGIATAADGDYIATSGRLTFAPGVTSQTISVTVVGDNDAESDETFSVKLSSASGAGISAPEGVGTIVDDDTTSGGGGGGGGNVGGGRGNGKNKAPVEEIEYFDPIWWFEGPGSEEHGHSHDHDLDDTSELPVAAIILDFETRTHTSNPFENTINSGIGEQESPQQGEETYLDTLIAEIALERSERTQSPVDNASDADADAENSDEPRMPEGVLGSGIQFNW